MYKKLFTWTRAVIACAIVTALIGGGALLLKSKNADIGAAPSPNFWKLSAGVLSPLSSAWTLVMGSATYSTITATTGTFSNLSVLVGLTVTSTVPQNSLLYKNSSDIVTASSALAWNNTTGLLTVLGSARISNSASSHMTMTPTANSVIMSHSTGNIVLSSASSTYISYLQIPSLNFPDNGGLYPLFNQNITSLTAATPIGWRGFGFNDRHNVAIYSESTGTGEDFSKTRFGLFPEVRWGGTNYLGGKNTFVTTTITTASTSQQAYNFLLASTSTMAFDCMITAHDTVSVSSSMYKMNFVVKRINDGATVQVGSTVETVIEDDASWGVSASTTSNGVALNVVGAGSRTINWKLYCDMLKIEP
jgi:hypothetical protein